MGAWWETLLGMEILPGTRATVRMWADPASVEEAALRQLRNVAGLRWTHGNHVVEVRLEVGETPPTPSG